MVNLLRYINGVIVRTRYDIGDNVIVGPCTVWFKIIGYNKKNNTYTVSGGYMVISGLFDYEMKLLRKGNVNYTGLFN